MILAMVVMQRVDGDDTGDGDDATGDGDDAGDRWYVYGR